MKIEFASHQQVPAGLDALVVPVTGAGTEDIRLPESLSGALLERLTRVRDDGGLEGDAGSATVLYLQDDVGAKRLLVAGLGPRDEVDADAVRTGIAAALRENGKPTGRIAWLLDEELPLAAAEQARAVVDGVLLGLYDPGRWKTEREEVVEPDALVLLGESADGTHEAAERAVRVADWTNRARDLANAPPNELTPERLGARAIELAAPLEGLSAEALGPDEIEALDMGAFAGVARGSHNPPRLIVMRYEPPAARDDVVLGLVGKAVTFDTGGISLKSATNMEDMKGDMAGGAAVVEAMGAIAELGIPLRTLAVVAATENMIGGGAFRPGDILRARNGKTIEITNTDAEGRLVLADALTYAREQGATHIVDFATLTGAMELALGDLYAGVFANDDDWREQIVAAGEASGDHAWPWPLHRRYRRFVDSDFADLKNSSTRRQGGPVLAAEFLQEFAGEGPWAHVDMAGTGFFTWSRGDYLSQRGGTGYGVRMIVELAQRLCEPAR